MNKKTFTTKKKAFSLIELSIVLIIIGLLVAGVTGGASLIKNAELRGLMSEARGYQTAVNAFQERFQALPGDYNTVVGGTFTSGTATGNGNNQIEFVNNGTATARMESNIAWQQLKNGGFVDATFTPASADPTSATSYTQDLTPGTNIPASKTKSAGWIFDFVNGQNVAIITGAITADMTLVSATAQVAVPVKIVVPNDALSIDTKTDDGAPLTGKVRGMLGSVAATTTSGCHATDTGVYKTALSTQECALSFQVDPNS